MPPWACGSASRHTECWPGFARYSVAHPAAGGAGCRDQAHGCQVSCIHALNGEAPAGQDSRGLRVLQKVGWGGRAGHRVGTAGGGSQEDDQRCRRLHCASYGSVCPPQLCSHPPLLALEQHAVTSLGCIAVLSSTGCSTPLLLLRFCFKPMAPAVVHGLPWHSPPAALAPCAAYLASEVTAGVHEHLAPSQVTIIGHTCSGGSRNTVGTH